MLRSRGSRSLPQPQPQGSWTTWETFCREEARETASTFIEKVRRFKSWNAQAREVHDSVFTNEFSAAFLEESSVLMAASGQRNGGSSFAASLPANVHGGLNTGPGSNHRDPSRSHTSGGPKSWWSGLLKWTKSRRARDRSSSGSSVSSATSSSNRISTTLGSSGRHRRRNIRVIKETNGVQLLNLNEQESEDTLQWSLCRLVLVEQQENYQIEIFSPPKNAIPKMSLFCMMIEEVRAASRLEIPDSESCFVVKSQNHGEYVFDVKTVGLKEEWVALLQTHSSRPRPPANGHVARSTGLSSHLATLPRAPPSHENTPLRSSGAAVSDPPISVLTLQSSPLMVSRSASRRSASSNNSTPVPVPAAAATVASSTASNRSHLEDVQLTNGSVASGGTETGATPSGKASIKGGPPPTAAAMLVIEEAAGNSRASQESLMVDMASFMRNYSVNTSPTRQRKTMSMFIDPGRDQEAGVAKLPPLMTISNKSTANDGEIDFSGKTASFPYGSPCGDSPPPLPKRAYRPRSMSTKVRPMCKKNVPLPYLPISPGDSSMHADRPNFHRQQSNQESNLPPSSGSSCAASDVPDRFLGLKSDHPSVEILSPSSPLPRDISLARRQLPPTPRDLETGRGCSSGLSQSVERPSSRQSNQLTSPVDRNTKGLVHPVTGKSCEESIAKDSVDGPGDVRGIDDNGSGDCGSMRSATPSGRGSRLHVPEAGVEDSEISMVCSNSGGNSVEVLNARVEVNGSTGVREFEEGRVRSPSFSLRFDTTRSTATGSSPSPGSYCASNSDRNAVTPDIAGQKRIGHLRNRSCGATVTAPALLHSSAHGNFNGEGRDEEEERGSHATLTFPYLTQQQSSPAQLQSSVQTSRETLAETSSEDQGLSSPLEASGFSTGMSRGPHCSPTQLTPDLPPSRRDLRRSSDQMHSSALSMASSFDAHGDSAGTGNPIFVETTDGHDYGEVTMHTTHPYEYWATNRQDIENLRLLSQFPWFHGMISRENATQLVLTANQESGNGQYLVRQSESREGDFVLTFNYHDRAKHLRLAVDSDGCQVQHLTFPSVSAMLDYFKTNSIPLESFYLNDDVKLSSFIDRSASDNFRTTTVVNVDQLNRVPPRRTRSLHLAMTRSVAAPRRGGGAGGSGGGSGTSSNSSSTNSLSQGRVAAAVTGWRQIFRTQRSSSAGNVGRVQRSHSHNSGSIQGVVAGGTSRHGSSENSYVWRNY